jgi:hypothetical protein
MVQKVLQESMYAPPKGQSSVLLFGEYLASLLQALRVEGVRPCVLRNYEGFPDSNIGHDIDFLVRSSESKSALRALQSVKGARVVGCSVRPSVVITFSEGVSPVSEIRSLQVDFNMSLNWKGLPILSTEAVLEASILRKAGNLSFFVPSPEHEAIISLLSSLLVGGWLKEKYFPKVQQVFTSRRSETIAALLPQFGLKTATHLVDSVIDGERRKILKCVPLLRTSLLLQNLRHRPVQGILAIVKHYMGEFAIRFSPKTLETVCVLDPAGDCQTAIIESLMPLLQSVAKVIENRQTRSWLFFRRTSSQTSGVVDHCAKNFGCSPIAMANVIVWLIKEWLSLFKEKKNLTLRICDSFYYGLLIDYNRGSQYGLPRWFMRLAGKLLPSYNLWILLDQPVKVSHSGKPQLSQEEAFNSFKVYQVFVKSRGKYAILDARKPTTEVTEEVYAVIINMLAQRTTMQLMKDTSLTVSK